ncbi:MAG TPA: hypothetical protein VH186_05155 [Chloroflexia bacterium]|nr:hypothetical protein [Chloroflexia bacterium]
MFKNSTGKTKLYHLLRKNRSFFELKGRIGLGLMAGLAALLLAACGDNPTNTPPPVPATNTPAPSTTAPGATTSNSGATPATGNANSPSAVPDESKAAYNAALQDLVKRTNVTPASVQVVNISQEEFNDSSLGCAEPGRMYTQVITPGYRIQLEANGQTYDYRTSLSGRIVVLCGPNNRPVKAP